MFYAAEYNNYIRNEVFLAHDLVHGHYGILSMELLEYDL